jgi:4-amino-4-deoxy-L-arabinose transferase-like glycosyltransferase
MAGVLAAAIVGGGLLADGVGRSSATYDEVAYLEIAARWWRTGDAARITRMGSPLTFWKLQQTPALWIIDRAGYGHWIDDPIAHQAELLLWVRLSSAWLWLAALALTAAWAGFEHGWGAAVLAAWLYALSPNLLAHGGLATMEMPLIAATAAVLLLFARFLRRGDRWAFWGAAGMCGVAFSCKFSAVVLPVLLAVAWVVEEWLQARGGREQVGKVLVAMLGFLVAMAMADVAITAGAMLPPSERVGDHPSLAGLGRLGSLTSRILETPLPQDWVGFARQTQHQRSGGPSYLLGERRMSGWWYYYFVCLAVKVPLSFGVLVLGRMFLLRRRPPTVGDRLALVVIAGTLAIVAIGSSRNYGFRYILFLAPAAIVGISGLAAAGTWGRRIAGIGLAGQALALLSIHPHELSYFNIAAGGPEGGRWILADSNLDWGQGARSLARLQHERPELRDLTFYYFGDTDPAHYGVAGTIYVIDAHKSRRPLPARVSAATPYIAVSRSLQHGPWGPPGYFRELDRLSPVAITPDHTVAIYRTADLGAL